MDACVAALYQNYNSFFIYLFILKKKKRRRRRKKKAMLGVIEIALQEFTSLRSSLSALSLRIDDANTRKI